MRNNKGGSFFTGAFVFGAMIFGMVLAGGTNLTPVSLASPDTSGGQSAGGQAVSVMPAAVVGGLPSFADLAEAVSPAVVSIQAIKIEAAADRTGRDPFEFFFPRRQDPRQQDPRQQDPRGQQPRQPRERRSDSSGSGFVISPDGLIVTNHHVIEDATELMVLLDGRQYPAEVKGDDPATDIALLQIKPDRPLTYFELGDSDHLRVGDWVMVIGSPLQLQNSVSVGVVSAKNRSINITADTSLEAFIQTDAAINFGNSGGPVVDTAGKVVGIATAINFGAENIGFAVPVSTLERILPQLRDTGVVKRGYLGVFIADLGYEDAQAWGLEDGTGVLVNEVTSGGPADEGGLLHGDIIMQVDQHRVEENKDLIAYVSGLPPGTKVGLKVFRNGKKIDKQIKLGERPVNDQAIVQPEPEEESTFEWLGLQYQNITPGLRESHGMSDTVEGVWVNDVAASSPLFDEGVRPGDVIVEINGEKIGGLTDFERIVKSAETGSYLKLYVAQVARDRSFFAVIRVP